MRRNQRFLAVALTALMILTGCSQAGDIGPIPDEPARGGVLQYGTDVQPISGGIDPYVANSFSSQNIIVQIYESLLTKSDDGELQPGLAESWKRIDPTTYRFTLREGVKFSDGTPLTVEDVVFSFNTMKKKGAIQAAYLTSLETVKAIDDRTVEFRLSHPSRTFLNLVAAEAMGVIVSKDWYTSTPPDVRKRTALGTGAFRLVEWQDQVVLKLRRNQYYWNEPYPYLDGVDFRIIPDDQSRLAALRQGTVDAIWLGDQQLGEQVADEGFQLGENAVTRNLSLYLDATSGPLANTKFRQALSLALDREQLGELAAYGYGKPSLVVPVGDPAAIGPGPNTPLYHHDPERARELLQASGVTDPTVTLTYPSDAAFARDVALYTVMKEQLKTVGITLELNPTPWSSILGEFVSGSYTGMVSVPGIYLPDPSGYFAALLSPERPTNKTGKAGERAAELYLKLRNTADLQERQEVLTTLEREVARKALIIIPYAVAQRQEIWSVRVRGYSVDPYSYRRNLKEAWLVP